MRRPRRRTSGITQDGILRLSLERSIETAGKREKGNGKLAVDHRDDRKQRRKIPAGFLEERASERDAIRSTFLKASECPFGSMTSASEISHAPLSAHFCPKTLHARNASRPPNWTRATVMSHFNSIGILLGALGLSIVIAALTVHFLRELREQTS